MLEKGSGKKGKSRGIGSRIFQKTEIIYPNEIVPIKKGIPELARLDLDNSELTKSAIYNTITHWAPGFKFPNNWDFRVYRYGKGFNIVTDLDLVKLNMCRSKFYFPNSKAGIDKALLVDPILKANEDLFFSAHYKSEILTNPINSSIINLKCNSLIKKSKNNIDQIELFQKVVLSEAKKIREAINNGHIEFRDILPLLDNNTKFKKWLQKKEPDANLIKEYYQSLTKNSLLDKLPGKSLRLFLFTGTGAILDVYLTGGLSTVIGAALGVGDTFLLDKFVKGWKPNQYIDEIENLMN